MKRKALNIVTTVLLFASCQNVEKVEKPKDLLPEDKMVEVLIDLSIINSARNYNKQQFEEFGIDPDQYVFDKHGVDSLQFERSNNYYSDNYSTYEDIYSRVKDSLQLKKSKLDSLRTAEEKMKDTIPADDRKRDSLDQVPPDIQRSRTGAMYKDSLVAPPSVEDIQ
ncbi:DUF4296 domain-containing protein [Salegentibacter chungangensis]|uniref:DUF4296 domain-containing protein n=1 Tax=Salegentibacter chungangensis TaxID=1335724 RepID=A0ABW3NPG1_9FLAO